MKKVVSNSDVPHLWANKVQDEARTSNGNFYFYKNAIYSYGSHFVIARHVENEDGEAAVLITTRTYSSSTGKHIKYTRQAANHLDKIYCSNPGTESVTPHTENFEGFYSAMALSAKRLSRARKPQIYLNEIAAQYELAKRYAAFFGLTIPTKIEELNSVQGREEYAVLQAKAEELRKANELKREKEEAKKAKKELVKFRNFAVPRMYYRSEVDYLRFNAKSNRIETSQGVEIPAKIALDFYTDILRVIKQGGCIDCKATLMGYRVKEINKDHVVIGCHKIEMKEIKRAVQWLS